jgi:hypothetical protein
MSYWENNEKIPIQQTQVSIPSTNGKSYDSTAGAGGKTVEFEIPPTVKFMDGKNSYLNADVKLEVGAFPTRLQLDPHIGFSSKNPRNRGTLGTSESELIDIATNPYYKAAPAPAGRNYGNEDYLTAKVSIPLHTGIFANSSKIFPVMATQGLFCELDLEDCANVVNQLDSVNRWRRIQQNPVFYGISDAGANLPDDGMGAFTEIWLTNDNNVTSVANCPFVKGERIGICSKTDPNSTAQIINAANAAIHLEIADITMDGAKVKLTVQTFRNAGANSVDITSGDFVLYSAALDQQRQGADGTQVFAALTEYAAKYTVSNMELVIQQVNLDPRYEAGMISKMREGGVIELDILSTTNYKHSLLASNRNATVDLPLSNNRAKSCCVICTDAGVAAGAAGAYTVPQLICGCRGTNALSLPYSEEDTAMDGRLQSCRTGLVGIIDNLTSYQWVIDDKLTPSRPVNVSKINDGKSISAQHLIELEKGLNQSRIVARSFCDYNRNFVVSRGYAINNGVANLNNKTNQLQLLYNEKTQAGVDNPPLHNKLLMCFVYHLRRISIKGDSVSVTV